MSHSESSNELGIPKSSFSQLLRTPIMRGYVDYQLANKVYRLGMAVLQITRHLTDPARR